MQQIANIFVIIVAVLHLYFMVLEMFFWTKPNGRKAFGTTEKFAEETKVLAANQGLYNGFLAAGLIWGLLQHEWHYGFHIKIFFLTCIIVAGIYGAYSTKKVKLFYIQSIPAIVALVLLHFK